MMLIGRYRSPFTRRVAVTLRLLGIEHTKLSIKFQGLDVRLTNIAGKTITDVLV